MVEALYDSKLFTDTQLEAAMNDRKIPDEEGKILRRKSKTAHDEIAKAQDVGILFLSKTALKRLEQYREEIKKASKRESWFEYLDEDWGATERCLKDFIQIAKYDLRVK